MKDRENCLRHLDEVDNMIQILDHTVERGMAIDPTEARNRFRTIRKKLRFVLDRVSAS
jgi:hypothetical protein